MLHDAIERRMLTITLRDKVNTSVIRNKTKVKNIIGKLKEAKWRWMEHIARRDDNKWICRLTEMQQ